MKNNKKHPLTFFREEGEKRKAMFQKGGYNVPLQKKNNGGPWHPPMVAPSTPATSSPYEGPTNDPAIAAELLKGYAGSARSAATQGKTAQNAADMMKTIRKKGGAVKTKKRK